MSGRAESFRKRERKHHDSQYQWRNRDQDQIDALLDYSAHLGMNPQMIENVLARTKKERAAEAVRLYS